MPDYAKLTLPGNAWMVVWEHLEASAGSRASAGWLFSERSVLPNGSTGGLLIYEFYRERGRWKLGGMGRYEHSAYRFLFPDEMADVTTA